MHDDARPVARLTVLSGPSGAGKDSVIELVRARSPWVWLSVSMTTREMRKFEVDGEHHLFVDRPRFERMIAGGQLLEWAEFAGDLYGTPRAPIEIHLRQGRPVLLTIDRAGARQVLAAVPGARLVCLTAPGEPPRCADGGADEGSYADEGGCHVVVNDHVERAADELVGLLGSCFLTPAQPRVSG